jgi:hypothetical protein
MAGHCLHYIIDYSQHHNYKILKKAVIKNGGVAMPFCVIVFVFFFFVKIYNSIK